MRVPGSLRQSELAISMGKPQRQLLNDQATILLRDAIISGQIAPGVRLTEREASRLLDISRVPARDALLRLETEGLIVNCGTARRVIELTERDIRELYDVRRALEELAVEKAAQHVSPESQSALLAKLEDMKETIFRRDQRAYTRNDVETHQLIWRQSGNAYLAKTLGTLVGPIFIFVSVSAGRFNDWGESLAGHEELVAAVNLGDPDKAVSAMRNHLDYAFQRTLRLFESHAPSTATEMAEHT